MGAARAVFVPPVTMLSEVRQGQGWGDEGVDCLDLKFLRIVLECFGRHANIICLYFVRREAGCEVRLWTELRSFGFSQKVETVKKG